MTIDIEFVRSQFPAFSEATFNDLAFFESAAGSLPCRFVLDRLERFYRERKVQPGESYQPSMIAQDEMDEARSRLAGLMGVETDEVSFGPSTTQNTYVLANAFRQWLESGDAIVVTNQDHEANSGPWRRLADDGIEIREWRIDPQTGHLDLNDLKPLLKGARLLAFPHCSNVIGEINDVAKIAEAAHAQGVAVCVDGVSYAPHGLPDVGALGPDIYLFSTYKTYGPHQGIMVIRRELGEALPNQGHYFNAGTLYKRFTPAGPDHAQVAACAGIADYIDALANMLGEDGGDPRSRGRTVHDAMRAREVELMEPLLAYLRTKNSVRLLGPATPENRAPTIGLQSAKPGSNLAKELANLGIAAAGGDFYATRPLSALGIDPEHGVLRLSFTHYTTQEEVDRLIGALDHVL